MEATRTAVPRGRHAPPLPERQTLQRERLFEAAASVFARQGYAEASAESISREAGMSKATFYEHFANKEDCILALFENAVGFVLGELASGAQHAGEDPAGRVRAGIRAFLTALEAYPNEAQTLLVEIIGAGPRAARRRDEVLQSFADVVDAENATAAARHADFPRFASPHDAFALVGAIAELASRQVRRGEPPAMLDLEPVIERLMLGALGRSAGR
ncbi:MAG: hypothetical protein QOG06_83 [Gaiellaceae bacterium]|jgi:AcrR family transcriptional regulator|nr:hypothetical protein [Gaiellaceae bacterium]MEA2390441.1 hypothetical protein [Solirubrobacteraceae bacterium]